MSQTDINEIEINGEAYIRKDSVNEPSAPCKDGKPYVIVRTYSAGVFAGYLNHRDGKEAKILEARRLWYWKGAASLSQLAVDGVGCPDECKFPVAVPSVELTEVIEILVCSEKAQKSIAKVKIWAK